MTVDSAIGMLKDGRAVKPSNWRGYVKKVNEDISVYPEYDPERSEAYPVGSSVRRHGARYLSRVQIDPVDGKVGGFDYSKWTEVDPDHDIVFVGAKSGDPIAVYHGAASLAGVSYERTFPKEPADAPDGNLFEAFLSTTWTEASVEEYEAQRTGTAGRW